ncbi:DUF1365 domain-containing protein [Rhizobium rhizophilum]|uniref:DUF1365 domain-containing protein n=1 Tax=Rhizobium rhizophilum TaxID=1850373 RepID=A0ABY2R1C6_9HYPH|nr:DUF1365 domain-containing protein [Rhizobium rhizophilum]THV17513.1 DUF1365 domain-containing protein [Rhizobium rhizophilum]
MIEHSAIYAGHVLHARSRPRKHSLRYSVFSLLVDLDEIDQLNEKLRLFGYNKSALYSVHDADHGNGRTGELRSWVEESLAAAGLDGGGWKIRMLCYPRILGYVFNPITVYFCCRPEGQLAGVLYEVCNTFNERHTYVIPVESEATGILRHRCAKEMYVSPFMPMNCEYNFRISPPAEDVAINIGESDPDGPMLFATFSGKRRPLSDRVLLRMLVAYPLMTMKVMGGIHWEALKLWWKGVPIYRHKPAAARIASTIVVQNGMGKS